MLYDGGFGFFEQCLLFILDNRLLDGNGDSRIQFCDIHLDADRSVWRRCVISNGFSGSVFGYGVLGGEYGCRVRV